VKLIVFCPVSRALAAFIGTSTWGLRPRLYAYACYRRLRNEGCRMMGYQLRPRGHINILDRQRMEETVCECYRVVKDEFDRLLG